MIKVLIIGLGSIGQRHAKALLEIGITNIAALRTLKGNKTVDQELNEKVIMFYDEKKAFDWTPTHLIISNPTSLHLHFINIAVEKNIDFFVEKPIDDSFEKLRHLLNTKIPTRGSVGYILRFHGIFQYLQNLIKSGNLGRVITAQLHVGQYLPNWHPYEDYRTGYYSKRPMGGGALRTLSHEIDLAQYLFGKYQSVYAKIKHLSDLEIDTDDVVSIISENEKCRTVNININFLDPEVIRKGTIYFSTGVVEYDWVKKIVKFISNSSSQRSILYQSDEPYDAQYIRQMEHFISDSESDTACTFREGIEVMRIIEACEHSEQKKIEICLV